jgi:hypothetical protein
MENQLPKFGGDRPLNPAEFYAEWDGANGQLYYYDKSEKENVYLPKDFKFVVLEQLNTVAGFNKERKRSFYANDVRDLRYEELNVRLDGQTVAKGKWEDIKDTLKAHGGKFAKSIYIAYKDENGRMGIGHIKASGAFVGEWFQFTKENAAKSGGVMIAGTEKRKEGTVEFVVPVFKAFTLPDAAFAEAVERYNEVREYLESYFSYVPPEMSATAEVDAAEVGEAGSIEEAERKAIMDESLSPAPQFGPGDLPLDDQFGSSPVPNTPATQGNREIFGAGVDVGPDDPFDGPLASPRDDEFGGEAYQGPSKKQDEEDPIPWG